nr:hypothetical protein [Providencia stuartii]ELR5083474.1 hypothetical protein [Providencia stuartii]
MCKISLASKIPSADNIYKSAKGHKTNSMAGAISGIQSTIDTMSANSRNMCALPADSTLNHSTKLTDNAKKAISQQINELTKTGNPSYEIKTALFWQYAIPLMKAQLNDNAIDDQTLIKHFTNTAALDGKIQRFSDQIDSFKQQKLGSAKATHLQEAYRAIEESIETLLLPNSPLDKSKPEPTTSSGLKQPAARSNEVDGQIPVDEPATSYMPTGSGNSYHNCHFGNKITYVSSDQKPATATATTTVNVNGRNITSSEKEAQQAPSAFAKTQNITSNKLQQQQNIKENLPENNMLVTKDESIQVSSS